MKNRAVLTSAVALVCENTSSLPEDYAERAPFLLASFCTQCIPVDKAYRKANGMSEKAYDEYTELSPDADFPLSYALMPPAVYYLASMLVIDENEVLSDKLFALYAGAVSDLQASLPMTKESITEVY